MSGTIQFIEPMYARLIKEYPMERRYLVVSLAWILWSQFFGKLEVSWIPLDGFDTKLECEKARDERQARL